MKTAPSGKKKKNIRWLGTIKGGEGDSKARLGEPPGGSDYEVILLRSKTEDRMCLDSACQKSQRKSLTYSNRAKVPREHRLPKRLYIRYPSIEHNDDRQSPQQQDQDGDHE